MHFDGRSGELTSAAEVKLSGLLRSRLPAMLRGSAFLEGLFLVLVIGAVCFHHFGASLVYSDDSAEYFAQANEFLRHEQHFFSLGANFVSSLGNIYYPVNFALLPEFVFAFHHGRVNPAIFYMIVSVAVFCANYFQGRALAFSGRFSALFGIAILAMTMPYTTTWFGTWLFSWSDPRWLPFFYVEPAALAAFLLIGRGNHYTDAFAIASFVLICVWIIGVLPKPSFIILGVIALYASAFTLCAQSFREAALKLAAGLIFGAVVLLGPLRFLQGFFGYTINAVTVRGVSIQGLTDIGAAVTALLYDPRRGPLQALYILGLPLLIASSFGALLMISRWRANRMSAAFGGVTLFLVVASNFLIYGVTVVGIVYPGVILSAIFLAARIVKPMQGRGIGGVAPIALRFAIVAVALAMIVQCYRSPFYSGIPYPPRSPALVEFLSQHLGFGTSHAFGGRFLNMAGRNPEGHSADTLAGSALSAAEHFAGLFGNDLTFDGLEFFEIPTPQEFNRFATPRNFAFIGRFLTTPGEKQSADYRIISHLDPKFLGLIGVKYVLTDAPIEDAAFSPAAVPLPEKRLRLYALDPVNLGQYSPTVVTRASDFANALELMARPGFDPRRDLVVDDVSEDALLPLSPASNVEIVRSKAGLRIRAESAGRSVLVLPFEYSHCLTIVSGAATVRKLFRGDFLLAAILFDRRLDADIGFRFGPFTNTRCREADALGAAAEHLTYDGFKAYREAYPELFK